MHLFVFIFCHSVHLQVVLRVLLWLRLMRELVVGYLCCSVDAVVTSLLSIEKKVKNYIM